MIVHAVWRDELYRWPESGGAAEHRADESVAALRLVGGWEPIRHRTVAITQLLATESSTSFHAMAGPAVFIGLAVLTAAAAGLVALTDTELARAHR